MTTQTHDSTTCARGFNGQKCEMCQFAQNARRTISNLSEAEQRGKIDSSPSLTPGMAVSTPSITPDFTHEWETAPAHLKPVFHPSLIRAAVFDVIDAGSKCGAETCTARHLWHFNPENESEQETFMRVEFTDAVIARLLEIRRISGERDPSSEYFYLRGERAGRIAQMLEENRVFRAMAERRGLG